MYIYCKADSKVDGAYHAPLLTGVLIPGLGEVSLCLRFAWLRSFAADLRVERVKLFSSFSSRSASVVKSRTADYAHAGRKPTR